MFARGTGTCFLVGMVPTMHSTDLIKLLLEDGWRLSRVNGSHHIHVHPNKLGHVCVPHPKKDLGKGLTHKVLKTAGLK